MIVNNKTFPFEVILIKSKYCFLFLFIFILIKPADAQLQGGYLGNLDYEKNIDVQILAGSWKSLDTVKYDIEFIVSNYFVELKSRGAPPYSFMVDSLNKVSVSGFIANWPPYDCYLNLITKDTLEIIYSIVGEVTDRIKYIKKKKSDSSLKITGAMKNVMWKGQLNGTIDLDTISNKENLYGLGPVEYLAGELLIVDGRSYKSTVLTDSTMKVEETYKAKAPFFVYANVNSWTVQRLPDSIQAIPQLESFLDQVTKNSKRPFAFKLNGELESASIHIVNLQKGSKVNSPEDAHHGQKSFNLTNIHSEIIGFFSTEHKAIFTHHDTFLHMHLITADKTQMGHLEEALFKKGAMKLYLPQQ